VRGCLVCLPRERSDAQGGCKNGGGEAPADKRIIHPVTTRSVSRSTIACCDYPPNNGGVQLTIIAQSRGSHNIQFDQVK